MKLGILVLEIGCDLNLEFLKGCMFLIGKQNVNLDNGIDMGNGFSFQIFCS